MTRQLRLVKGFWVEFECPNRQNKNHLRTKRRRPLIQWIRVRTKRADSRLHRIQISPSYGCTHQRTLNCLQMMNYSYWVTATWWTQLTRMKPSVSNSLTAISSRKMKKRKCKSRMWASCETSTSRSVIWDMQLRSGKKMWSSRRILSSRTSA